MAETPEQLAEGRASGAFIGRRITDLTGSAATSGNVPYFASDATLAETSDMNYSTTDTRLTVTGLGGSTVVLGETTDPGAAAENTVTLYAVNVSGSTVLRARFGASDSQAQTIATEQ